MPKNAEYVLFNDGTDENRYALVVRDHGSGTYDLAIAGETGIKTSVPHREPSDYAAGGGGGYTWHEA
jgi:hypothetical protein